MDNKDKITSLSKLREYIERLEFVCANERSSQLAQLLEEIIEKIKPFNDNCSLFTVYWEFFIQTYYYVQKKEQTEYLIENMRTIAWQDEDNLQKALVYTAIALFSQFKGDYEDAIKYTLLAKQLVEPFKNKYQNTYYRILYTYTHFFIWFKERDIPSAVENMEECFLYYHQSYNSLGMIKSISLLLRFYILLNQGAKIKKLLKWIFVEEQIQHNLIDTHFIWLYRTVGIIFTIQNKLDDALGHLTEAYKRIKRESLQHEVMYEYVEILRFLSRCYAYQGDFQQSHNLLVELAGFMETDFVKKNYFKSGIKLAYFSTCYTLLFIFVQLDLDISNVQDEKLRQIYEYTKSLISESHLSKDLLLDPYSDEEGTKSLLNDETDKSRKEVYITLHQLLITHKPYTATKKTADAINKIKNYTFDPLYADILLGKIHLAMGNFTKFKKTAEDVRKKTTDEKAPILQIWSDFFTLLSKYLEEPSNLKILEELKNLEIKCSQKNFRKMAEEIKLYQKLISSSRTIKKFEDRFQQTAFMDVFNEQSKKMVIEYLDEQ